MFGPATPSLFAPRVPIRFRPSVLRHDNNTALKSPESFSRNFYGLAAPEFKIGGTTVVGRDVTERNVEFFGSIPFTEPPVGKLRFKPPVLKTRLDTDTFNATQYGKTCLQPDFSGPPKDISEDCLFINIYRPAGTRPKAKLPIYDASSFGYMEGVSSSGRRIHTTAVAWVLRLFTSISTIALDHSAIHKVKKPKMKEYSTWVLRILWLPWNGSTQTQTLLAVMRANAGSINIGTLLLNRKVEKLIRGAILESGTASCLSAVPAAEKNTLWESFVRSVPSCAGVAASGKTLPCLQDATEDEILTSYLKFINTDFLASGLAWVPTLDLGPGSLFPGVPSELYRKGKFARIPFIAGTTLDEGTSLAGQFRNPNTTEEALRRYISGMISPLVAPSRAARVSDRILELYPDVPALGSPYGTGDELWGLPSIYKRASSLQGDMGFDAPRRQWSQAAASHGHRAYGYLFTQPQPGDPAVGVTHGTEIPWMYGGPPDPSPSAQQFSKIMMDYWISFAVSLDPNDGKGSERPIWPEYTKKEPLEGGNTTAIPDNYRKEPIGFIIRNTAVFRR
ncbi:lipase I [Coprinopsis cinerea okayama7|uniref:Lipase I n=1 Tax=Coprinopsis cinerea (strain Okayama-7 / 130 / ATCC MYA-4618 / FGSC 9003) TaxID=240176 RepID=A8NCQ6_COPC7|nr:lipase I [Coprinopsis cinerea okayama7\|eukprot:XP_001832600.2 lipase I [Coprinopsis cinerea okayama7\